jgi:predicted transcriptional regulator
MQTQVIHVRMPCDLVERLDEYAQRTHRTRPASVIHAIEELLAPSVERGLVRHSTEPARRRTSNDPVDPRPKGSWK